MKLVTVAEMQQIEREADASGLSYDQMMENAGHGLAHAIVSAYSQYWKQGVLALVGSGNNGGDALVALEALAIQGWKTTAYLVRPRSADDPLIARLKKSGGEVETFDSDVGLNHLETLLRKHAILLDGVLGTGIRLPLKEEVTKVLAFVRERLGNLHVVAVDCPSGVDSNSGEAAPECIPAERTVTMAAVKVGLLKFPAFSYVAELELAGIGLADRQGDPGIYPSTWAAVHRRVADKDYVRSVLPERPLDAHKGTFGTALIVAGSANYTGAALLAGKAAYRSGAGLVTLAIPRSLHSTLAGHFVEATWMLLPEAAGFISAEGAEVLRKNLGRATALLLGPGFGLQEATKDFLDRFLSPRIQETKVDLPSLVIDADGLKHLASLKEWSKRLPGNTILTPHPGEMAILTSLPTSEIQSNRLEIAEHYARTWGQVVVLKGAFTVVAAPDSSTAVIPVASSALARAGTGDVLAGLITGLRAQGVAAFPAAVAGAWIHGQAGLEAGREFGNTATVLAGDVLQAVIPIMRGLS